MTPAQARAAEAVQAALARLEAHLAEAGPTARLSFLMRQFGDRICPPRYFIDSATPVLDAIRQGAAPPVDQALIAAGELLDRLRAIPARDLTVAAHPYDSPYRGTARALADALPMPHVDAVMYQEFAAKMDALYRS